VDAQILEGSNHKYTNNNKDEKCLKSKNAPNDIYNHLDNYSTTYENELHVKVIERCSACKCKM
jgi:hypothetical protein